MKNFARLAAAGLALLLLSACAHQVARGPGQPTTVHVGQASVLVPAPAGFTEVAQSSPEVMTLFRTFTPPTNILLAVFYTDEDARRLQAGRKPELTTYILVQAHRRALTQDMSTTEFEIMRRVIRTQQTKLMEQGRARANELLRQRRSQISSQAGADVNLSVQNMAVKGVFVDNDRVIGMAAVNSYRARSGGVPVSFRVAGASTVVHVKNKPLFVYVFEKYESDRNLDHVRHLSVGWVEQILRDNGAR